MKVCDRIALLKSASAAEIAKRFNAGDGAIGAVGTNGPSTATTQATASADTTNAELNDPDMARGAPRVAQGATGATTAGQSGPVSQVGPPDGTLRPGASVGSGMLAFGPSEVPVPPAARTAGPERAALPDAPTRPVAGAVAGNALATSGPVTAPPEMRVAGPADTVPGSGASMDMLGPGRVAIPASPLAGRPNSDVPPAAPAKGAETSVDASAPKSTPPPVGAESTLLGLRPPRTESLLNGTASGPFMPHGTSPAPCAAADSSVTSNALHPTISVLSPPVAAADGLRVAAARVVSSAAGNAAQSVQPVRAESTADTQSGMSGAGRAAGGSAGASAPPGMQPFGGGPSRTGGPSLDPAAPMGAADPARRMRPPGTMHAPAGSAPTVMNWMPVPSSPGGAVQGAAPTPFVDAPVDASPAEAVIAPAATASATPLPGTAGLPPAVRTALAEILGPVALAAQAAPDGAPAGSVASMVVYNAAMIPGWPFADAMVRDRPGAARPADAGLPAAMTPEEMAAYLAAVAAKLTALRHLRKRIEEIGGAAVADSDGFLLGLVRALEGVIAGLTAALETETVALEVETARAGGPRRRLDV